MEVLGQLLGNDAASASRGIVRFGVFFLLAAVATIVFDFFDRYGTFLFLSIIRVPWTVDRDLAFKRPFLSF